MKISFVTTHYWPLHVPVFQGNKPIGHAVLSAVWPRVWTHQNLPALGLVKHGTL